MLDHLSSRRLLLGLTALCAAGVCALPVWAADSAPEFNRDIRPILSENCFACHGPDPASRKAGLRLDREEGLFGKRENGVAVVPGKPAESPLFERVMSTDTEAVMPPPNSHKKLSSKQKEAIRQWIASGAKWQPHWSFLAPTRPAVPTPKNAQGIRNAIDAFVRHKLEQHGLAPAAEADRRTLARRAALDLTGLPPDPADVQAFVDDRSPDAYEKWVDRLLASDAFGEHRARYWLDAARYGDTHGLHNDNYREMWPYRDWVIRAFNRNLPFDQFTIEQIAGDLLPNRTLEQQIASGFHRCNITTGEGGSINDEVLAMYAKDRVETTGTVWLGLTLGCASCHDHKFDPVTTTEFYQFAAFFRNTTQGAMDGNRFDNPPIIVVPGSEDRAAWSSLQEQLASNRDARQKRLAAIRAEFDTWLKGVTAETLPPIASTSDTYFATSLDQTGEKSLVSSAGEQMSAHELPNGIKWTDGPVKDSKGLLFETGSALGVDGLPDLDAERPMTWACWIKIDKNNGNYVIASDVEDKAKVKTGWRFEIRNGSPSLTLQGEKGGDSIAVNVGGRRIVNEKQWTHVVVTYDGSRTNLGLQCYVNGKLQTDDQVRPTRRKDEVRKERGELQGPLTNKADLRLGSDGTGNLKGAALADFQMIRKALSAEEAEALYKWRDIRAAVAKADGKALNPLKNVLAAWRASQTDAEYRQLLDQNLKVEFEVRDMRLRSAVTHVMSEKDNAMPMANILFRGQYDQPREAVPASVPAVFPKLPSDQPANRLGLAKWLMSPTHPLTARVTVNRFWQEIFGTGLVKTSEDFGIMGENPSHPELLDWLAVEFRETGWDMKRLLKLMVTSATYRQAAVVSAEKRERDPANRLLSRGPRFRMDGEMLRDFALASSGLLVRKVGGPSVKPYQPPGVWEAVAMFGSNTRFYQVDSGENLYRRSLYWFWKRSAPPASLEIFGAPSRENCTVRRERNNTPLQALVTMNDVQFVEAARHLAQRAIKEHTDPKKRLDFIALAAIARPLEPDETAIALTSLQRFQTHYSTNTEAATKLISYGESKPDASLAVPDLAAWTLLASQIMNLDEALNK